MAEKRDNNWAEAVELAKRIDAMRRLRAEQDQAIREARDAIRHRGSFKPISPHTAKQIKLSF